MRRRSLLGLIPAVPVALLVGACEQPPAGLSLDLRFPQGLLDQATAMKLYVFDAGLAKCDETTGHVDKIPGGDATLEFPLGQEGCSGQDSWCATIQLDKDGAKKTFAIIATKAGATIAEGCTTDAVDQDPLTIEIQAHRYTPPKCCGNGVLEPGEQCDTGVAGSCDGTPATMCSGIVPDAVCSCDCTAQEILLSIDDMVAPNLKNGAAGTKSNLALAYGPGGVNNPVMLRALYENTDAKAIGGADISESFLAEDLNPIATPFPLSLQLQLPLLCNAVTGSGMIREQRSPAIAAASGSTLAIVYQSDEAKGGEDYDIALTPQNADGCTDTAPCAADADCATRCDMGTGRCAPSIKVNVTPGGCSSPRVARGPDGVVLVTWKRKEGIFGRIWKTDGTVLPAQGEILIAAGGNNARVAGNADGFRVVYQGAGAGDPDGIFMVPVTAEGVVGGAVLVNSITADFQDQPDIGMLADGSTLVAWHSGGDVIFQRFDKMGKAVKGDQDAPLNTTGEGAAIDQRNPAVAGGNGFFLVAWEVVDSAGGGGNIAARLLGGQSGFGFNSVSGQNDEFLATDPKIPGDRTGPAVALGSYAVIGWEDRSEAHPGVYVRRFPAPTAE